MNDSALLQRWAKGDAEVVARCKQVWHVRLLWTSAQVHVEIMPRWPELRARLSVANMRAAGATRVH